jgi:hypothetical protein
MPDADVVLRSSDLIDFRVRRSTLATSSPFFEDLFSLPQWSDREVVGGLPVVRLPEDAEVLNSIVSMLYPVSPEVPKSVDNVLTLLAACQKYDMTTALTSIRAEVSRRELLSPTSTEHFRVFAIACRKRLIPEMKAAALLTLTSPGSLSFVYIGSHMRYFESWAMLDLFLFHQRWKDSVTSCHVAFFDIRNGPSKIWVDCPTPRPCKRQPSGEYLADRPSLPTWFDEVFASQSFKQGTVVFPSITRSSFRPGYLKALRGHISKTDCSFCMKTHTLKGEEYCVDFENPLARAWDVQYSPSIELPESKSASPPSVCICYFSLGLLVNSSA